MIDFNTKRSILKRLRKKREDNKLLWLPCVIAELFVKLWYNIACTVDMALSDSRGNFLGVKPPIEQKRRRRQDDIVHVKKPFLGRVMSAVLAACFVVMVMPEFSFSAYAFTFTDGYEYTKYNDQSTEEIYYRNIDKTNAAADYVTIDEYKVAYGAVWVHWTDSRNNADGFYIECYEQGTNTPVNRQQANAGATEAVFSGLRNDPNITYEIKVVPYKNIQLYNYTPAIPESAPDAGDGVPANMAPAVGQYFEQIGTTVAGSRKNVGSLNSSMANPEIKKIVYDGNINATLTWDHVKQVSGPEANLDTSYAEGYIVFQRTVNAETSVSSEYKVVDQITDLREGVNLNNGEITCEVTVQQGVVYEFYVLAYRSVFGQHGYHEENPGMITSGGANTQRPARLTTTPTRPKNLKITTNKKDTLSLSWAAGAGSCSGYHIYRSETALDEESMKNLTPNIADNPYYNSATGEWDYSRYIRDKAVQVEIVSNATKKYDDKDPTLVVSKTYFYYVMAYLTTDSSGSCIYGLPANASGSIGASLIPPQGFIATPSDGKVSLKWDAVQGADGYKIHITKIANYDGSDTGVGNKVSVYVTKNSYEHIGLFNGDVYSYQVQAYINATSSNDPSVEDYDKVMSDFSDKRTVTVGVLLNIPQDMKVTTKDGETTVSWSKVDGAEGYILYYWQPGASNPFTIELTKPGFNHTGLKNDETWSYKVIAFKTVNGVRVFSDESITVSIIVGDKLDAPKDFTGIPGEGRIDLSWTAPKGAEGFIIHATSGGRTYEFDVSKTKYEHIGLNNGDVWSYWIEPYKTVNGVRIFGGSSNTITLTVGDVLSAPQDFTAVTSDGKVTLSWTASKGAEGYILYAYSSGKSFQFDVSKTKYEHTGLNNGEVWTYYVVAYKTVNGVKSYSSPTKSISVTIGISLNAALDLTATAGNRQIDLSWSKVEGAEGYVLYLYNKKTMEFEPIAVISGTKYSHTGLKNGQEYTYMVAPFKTINGKRYFGEYSMAVTAIPTTGSSTDIDRTLNIKGTTPYGISHSEYISAKANHDAFEETVDVYFTTNKESTAAVKDIMKTYGEGLKSFIIYPFDISIYQENTLIEVDPNEGYSVTITMPIPDKLIAYRDYITVVHINENADEEEVSEVEWLDISPQQLEVLPCAIVDIDNVWCVQFECTSFSPYAFVIYKKHILDASAGAGFADGSFAGSFNSGLLLFTALPDILPDNKKLKVVYGGKKRYRIKRVTKR
ncbi:MAG: hypothetical protein J6C96_11110 [Oscillospiraceae bacterium]|nr:hypothetical protein [Oscillospiraceae bacterium]